MVVISVAVLMDPILTLIARGLRVCGRGGLFLGRGQEEGTPSAQLQGSHTHLGCRLSAVATVKLPMLLLINSHHCFVKKPY